MRLTAPKYGIEYDRMEMNGTYPQESVLFGWWRDSLFFPHSFYIFLIFPSPQKAGDDPDKLLGDGSTTNSDLEKYTDPIKCKDLGYAQLGSKPLRPLDGCAMSLLPFPGPACL